MVLQPSTSASNKPSAPLGSHQAGFFHAAAPSGVARGSPTMNRVPEQRPMGISYKLRAHGGSAHANASVGLVFGISLRLFRTARLRDFREL